MISLFGTLNWHHLTTQILTKFIIPWFYPFFFSDENYIEVQFHIKQGFLRVSEVMINAMTVDAVRAIVGCHSLNILKSYYDDSTNSVHLVIEEFFLKYLLSLTNEDKDILRNLEIDFFIVDFITVYLEHPKGKSRSITKRL